jgi:hypothetical protein
MVTSVCSDRSSSSRPLPRPLARELLRLPRLPLAPREDAVEALEALVGEQGAPTADDAQRMEQALLAAGGGSQQDEVDEFALPMMRLLLRAHGGRAADAAERLRQQFASKGSAYAAHWARIAGLHALAEARDRQRGPQLLAEALADAWQHKDQRSPRGEERMRLVMKLTQLVPAFGLRERGLELLDGVQRRAAEEPDLYVRNELLMASVLAASKLGESKAAFELVEGLARTAIDTFRAAPARGGGEAPRWLMFETLEHVADAAVEMGDARRGLPLVQRIADTAHHALDQAGQADSEGRFFYCRALIRAGRAALALGDPAGAEKAFADAFTRMRQLKQLYLVDLLGLAVETASEMDGAPRYALARQVLEVTAGSGATGELFDRAQIEQVMARLARDMVQGESAYAAALKRWKGREERSIRDRVATGQVGS